MVWILSLSIILLLVFVLLQRARTTRVIDSLKNTNKALNETRQEVSSQSKTIETLKEEIRKINRKR